MFEPRCICRGKAIPLQAWTGQEGSRSLTLPGGKVVRLTHRPPLPPENIPSSLSVRGWVRPDK